MVYKEIPVPASLAGFGAVLKGHRGEYQQYAVAGDLGFAGAAAGHEERVEALASFFARRPAL